MDGKTQDINPTGGSDRPDIYERVKQILGRGDAK